MPARLVAIVLFLHPLLSSAQEMPPLALERVVTGLAEPVAITHAGDDRLFISLKGGRVVILRDGEILPAPFLDITGRVLSFGVEQGLASIAFPPDHHDSGYVFAGFTAPPARDGVTVLARYSLSPSPDVALPGSEKILLAIEQPDWIHNGGALQFGPDGYLYVGTGDGGGGAPVGRCVGQADDTLLGKLLRLDVTVNVDQPPYYAVPADNPFVGPGDPPDEVWAKGFRNPWRFTFDRATGDLFIADVGAISREEVSWQPAASSGGENYGWGVEEGSLCLPPDTACGFPLPACGAPELTPPILEYTHDEGCAIIGGYVYRGSELPDLQGAYLYGDFCFGTLWAAQRAGELWQTRQLDVTAPGLTSFGEDAAGEIYLAAGDSIYRLAGPEGGTVELVETEITIDESAGSVEITVERRGRLDALVTIDYATADGSAVAGVDYVDTAGTLTWGSGEGGEQSIVVPVLDDLLLDGDRSLTVTLSDPTGGAVLGSRSAVELTILDDDGCQAGPTTLCFDNGRFQVEIEWRTALGTSGLGTAVPLSDVSGFFWFFGASNPEVFVKVLDACVPPFDHFWVFAAGLTDVETLMRVEDKLSGQVRQYRNLLGSAFEPIRDTMAFATCP